MQGETPPGARLLTSERLRYRRLAPADLDAFHGLLTDAHVKRYLLDGETVGREWARAEIEASERRFGDGGCGLWLVFEGGAGAVPVGFTGFRPFPDVGPEPQLLYAFLERVTGRGYATEAGRALVRHATERLGWDRVVSAADEPNRASLRVLEKLGFVPCGRVPGSFGAVIVLERRAGS
jgi:RimJ/RimL family protein N-acetyltransferase